MLVKEQKPPDNRLLQPYRTPLLPRITQGHPLLHIPLHNRDHKLQPQLPVLPSPTVPNSAVNRPPYHVPEILCLSPNPVSRDGVVNHVVVEGVCLVPL